MFIHILGVTCVGKDSLIEFLAQKFPNDIGTIQVGKEFRKRYPPEFFKGLGAMQSTEDEAYKIYCEEREKCRDKKHIFVSSQPRLITQVSRIEESEPGTKRLYIFIRCSEEEINRRINERFPLDDLEITSSEYHKALNSRHLASDRVINDRIQNYDVLLELIAREAEIIVLESCPVESLAECVMSHVSFMENH